MPRNNNFNLDDYDVIDEPIVKPPELFEPSQPADTGARLPSLIPQPKPKQIQPTVQPEPIKETKHPDVDLSEFVTPEEYEEKYALPERGKFGTTAAGLLRGVAVETPSTALRALRSIDQPGGTDIVRGLTTPAIETVEALPERFSSLRPSKSTETSYIDESLYTGASQLAPSLLSSIPGVVLGAAAGPIGAAAGGAASAATIFGLAEYDRAQEQFLKHLKGQGLSDEDADKKAHEAALKSAVLEGGIEALTNFPELLMLGAGKVAIAPGKAALKQTLKQLMRPGLKKIGKSIATTAPIEVAGEALTAAGQSQVAKDLGIEGMSPREAAIHSIGPTLVMSAMFGVGVSGMNSLSRRKLQKTLASSEANKVERLRAAKEIGDAIEKSDANVSAEWMTYATEAIQNNESIPLDLSLTEGILANQAGMNLDEMDKLISDREKAQAERGEIPIDMLRQGDEQFRESATGRRSITPEPEVDVLEPGPRGLIDIEGAPTTDITETIERGSPLDLLTGQEVTPGPTITPRIGAEQRIEEQRPTPPVETRTGDIGIQDVADTLQEQGKREQYDSGLLDHIRSRIEQGEAGKRQKLETGEVVGGRSSFPEWFSNKGFKKKETLSVIDKAISGKKLTGRQRQIIDTLVESGGRDEFNKVGGGETIDLATSKKGSKFEIDGELFTVKGLDEEGNAILEDGITRKVDPFETLNVDRTITEGKGQTLLEEATVATEAPQIETLPEDVTKDIPEEVKELKGPTEAHEIVNAKVAGQAIEVNVSPTEAQKESGVYKKGHVRIDGLDISIENPKGSVRSGVNGNGKAWEINMNNHYGYIKGTKGKDKDHLDVFIGSNPKSKRVFIVNQVNPKTGKFDEHKIMMNFNNKLQARSAYQKNYQKGWKGLGSIHELPTSNFKEWLKGDTTKPYSKEAVVDKERRQQLRGEKQERKEPRRVTEQRRSKEEVEAGRVLQARRDVEEKGKQEAAKQKSLLEQEKTDKDKAKRKEGKEADEVSARISMPMPEHIKRAMKNPRQVSDSVGIQTKQSTKQTLELSYITGEILPEQPIRLTTIEELKNIHDSKRVTGGKGFEGQAGISAQYSGAGKPIVAYGPNDRVSAAIVFPEDSVVSKGQQPNEVKINPDTDISSLRFVVDGFPELLGFDDLADIQEEAKKTKGKVNNSDFIQTNDTLIEDLTGIVDDINKIVAKGSEVKLEKEVTLEGIELGALSDWGLTSLEGLTVEGKHITRKTEAGNLVSMIHLAANGPNLKGAAYHEAWHGIDFILLNDKERAMMKKAFPSKDGIASSEIQADAFADYAQGKKSLLNKEVKTIFERIKIFLKKLNNMLMNRGFDSYESIFEKAYAGTFRERHASKESVVQPSAKISDVIANVLTEAKEVVKQSNHQPKEMSPFDKSKDDFFSERDWKLNKASVEAQIIQKGIAEIADEGRTLITRTRIYGEKSKRISYAMLVYNAMKENPKRANELYPNLSKDQRAIIDEARILSRDSRFTALAQQITDSFAATGAESLDAGVITNTIENYASRVWDLKGKKALTEAGKKFGATTKHSKKRVFETIFDGFEAGYELKVKDAADNLRILKDEMTMAIESKKLLTELGNLKNPEDENLPMLSTGRRYDGYKEVDHPGFRKWNRVGKFEKEELNFGEFYVDANSVIYQWRDKNSRPVKPDGLPDAEQWKRVGKESEVSLFSAEHFIDKSGNLYQRQRLYAPEELASRLNKIFGVSKLKGIKVIDKMTRYNAEIKSTILFTSLFHHQAFLRSYMLATRKKTLKEWSPMQALKDGRAAIEEMGPEVELLIRNGLTVGDMQEFKTDLYNQEQTEVGKMIDRIPGGKAVKDKLMNFRDKQQDYLFRQFGAPLKIMAGLIEYRNALQDHPELDANYRAKMVSEMVNADFGGLHLERMERDPTIQHIFRLLALAPDWCCDSFSRAMTKTGWKYYHELEVGKDEILSFNPNNNRLEWNIINDMYVNENYDGEMVKVKSHNRAIVTTPDHKCFAYSESQKNHGVVLAKDLTNEHHIPRISPMILTEEETYSDRFIKLVGWLITDGYVKKSFNKLANGETKEYNYGKITQAKPKTVKMLKDMGLKYHIDNGNWDHDNFKSNYKKYVFTIPKEDFKKMEKLGIVKNKNVNWEFLSQLTKSQLELLEETMMLGCGTGQGRFSGKEDKIFSMTLIRTMLGKASTFYQQEDNCWRTRALSELREHIPCRNNIEKIYYKGTIWCPSVKTGFWLAEREGLMFITGNTESNVRTMIKTIKGGTRQEQEMYRRMWAALALKGFSAVFVANLILSAFDDEDFIERYKIAWETGNLRWLGIDITPIYKVLGGAEGKRKYFSLFGHFQDPIKFIVHPVTSAHHKGSPLYRIFHEAMTGVDWKGDSFTGFKELLGVDDKGVYLKTTKEHRAGERKGGKLRGKLTKRYGGKVGPIEFGQFPTYVLQTLKGSMPVQAQQMFGLISGEIDKFDAISRGLGLKTASAHTTPRSFGKYYVRQYLKAIENGDKERAAFVMRKLRAMNRNLRDNEEEPMDLARLIKQENRSKQIDVLKRSL